MKIIALMLVKNESWILETTLPSLFKYIDELIVLDGGSSDNSVEIIKSFGGTVIIESNGRVAYSDWRQTLLEAGRAQGGTHFVFLDADEAFSANFSKDFFGIVESMKPGQKLVLDWICLWKSPFKIRFDNSIWTLNEKDVVYCDNRKENYKKVTDHEPRTPGLLNPQNCIRIPRSKGAILHFQFVSSSRFQMKQAFVQCRELVEWNREPKSINLRYEITRDKGYIFCVPTPKAWLNGMVGLDKLNEGSHYPYRKYIQDYFSNYGVEYFEKLDIWHIPELHREFISLVGRTPSPDKIIKTPREIWLGIKQKIKYFLAKLPLLIMYVR